MKIAKAERYVTVTAKPIRKGWGRIYQGGYADTFLYGLSGEIVIVNCCDPGWSDDSLLADSDPLKRPVRVTNGELSECVSNVKAVVDCRMQDVPEAAWPIDDLVAKVSALRSWLSSGDNLYIHCAAGVSRSAYITFALLMLIHEEQYEDTRDRYPEWSAKVRPNKGFVLSLRQFSKQFKPSKRRHSPDVSIVVPTLNQCDFTVQAFASIAQIADGLRYEIIVVDNGSDDDTLSFVGSHTEGQLDGGAQGPTPPLAVRVLHNTEKHNLARSWNMGVEAAAAPVVIVTNNDVIYGPGSLRALVEAARGEKAGFVLPLSPQDVGDGMRAPIEPPTDPPAIVRNLRVVSEWYQRNAARFGWQRRPVTHPYVRQGGYCFAFRKAVYDSVGPFDEGYGITGEDYDWFARVLRRFKAVQVAEYVEHYGQATRGDAVEWNTRMMCRARFRLAEVQEASYEVVSVIIPTWERVDTLREALKSVVAQSYPHWKCYVIDDASQDWDRVQKMRHEPWLAAEDGRIWFFHKGKREGPGAARNMGLEICTGKFVAFLDSDDKWTPDHLQRHLDAHAANDVEMVYSDSRFAWRRRGANGTFFTTPAPHPMIHYTGPFDRAKLAEFNYIQTSGVTVWGETARTFRFPVDKMIEEDWDYFKLVAAAGEVAHLNVTTVEYFHSRDVEADNLTARYVPGGAALSDIAKSSVVIPYSGEALAPPQLGIVIPTRGRLTLGRAIASRYYADIPVCVVDDASSDGEAVARLVFGSCCLLRLDRQAGPGAARNRGVEYLPAEWIQFLDDDDLLTADWYQRLDPHLTGDVDVLIGRAWVPDGANGFAESSEVFTSQICVRRSVFLEAGGFAETAPADGNAGDWAEERELLDRLRARGARVKEIGVPIVTRPSRGGTGDFRVQQRKPCTPCGEKRGNMNIIGRGNRLGG